MLTPDNADTLPRVVWGLYEIANKQCFVADSVLKHKFKRLLLGSLSVFVSATT
ncbi:hypothetical protein J2861_003859 [Agrobacterium tumefaciens]|nr:hypothetical protein [Agrobacterium tumefaciens]